MLDKLRRMLFGNKQPAQPSTKALDSALQTRRDLLDRKDEALEAFRKAQKTLSGQRSAQRG